MSPSPTSAAAAAAAAAFTAPGWLGQIPTAPPGQLPPSSLWGLHGKDVKTEQQIVVSNSLLSHLLWRTEQAFLVRTDMQVIVMLTSTRSIHLF